MVTNWIEKPLSELFDFSGGLSASRADLSTIGHPYLHYGDIHGSKSTFVDVCIDNSIPRLNVDLTKVSKGSLLSDGDVVFVDASEDDEGASRHLVVRNEKNAPFISGLHTIVAKAKTNELDNLFKEFCFQTAAIKAQFKFYAVGTKVTGISKTAIGKILLSYPQDTAEQRRIAAALSDADALITALEKLIAKKRAIKQGAMQELLTGKRRLQGFKGEWAETTIGDLSIKLLSGYAFKSQTYSTTGKYKIITIANVQQNKLDTSDCSVINKFPQDLQEYHLLKRGDILISLTGNVGRTCIVDEDYLLLNQRVGLFSEIAIDKAFFYHVLQDARFISEMIASAKGGAQPNLGNKDVYEYKLLIPPTIAEQTAIAEILSDMDAEIDKLTARLNKLRGIKQGMMSELLTGKIRLVEQDATINTENLNAVAGREN